MTPRISVVAQVGKDAADVTHLVRSLDAQTLPVADFDVVFALDDALPEVQSRLAELARRRPNLRIEELGATAPVAAAAERGTNADRLLYLSPSVVAAGARLLPRALEDLAAYAGEQNADLVVVRADTASMVNDLFATDGSAIERVVDPFVGLFGREFVLEHGFPADADGASALLAAANRTAVFADYPCITVPDFEAAAAPGAITLSECSAEWSGAAIRVSVRGRSSVAGELRIAVQGDGGQTYWLAGRTPVTTDAPFEAHAEIDLQTAASGRPLDNGIWRVVAGVHRAGAAWTAQQVLTGATIRPAVLAGKLVAPASKSELTWDVGATKNSPVGRFAADGVRIAETAAGTTMTAELPGLYVHEDSDVAGTVLLGKFPLAARLSCVDGVARLTCLLSGMPGSSALSTKFGTAKPAPSGLDLHVSDVGEMTVQRARRKTPAPAPATAGLRSKVPPALEPAVRRLARNKTMRKLYHRFTRAGSAR